MQPFDVLVIEDDPDLSSALALMLELEGFRAKRAASGEQALEMLQRSEGGALPSLLLLDVRLPGMCGWELRRTLRRDPLLAGLPVIVLSASAVHESMSDMDVAAYVPKPPHIDQLVALVTRYVGRTPPARRS